MDVLPPLNHSFAMALPLVILLVCFAYDTIKKFLDKRRKRREEQEKMIEMLTSKVDHGSPPPMADLHKRKVSYNIKKGSSRYAVYDFN
jgi:hypothetical protein